MKAHHTDAEIEAALASLTLSPLSDSILTKLESAMETCVDPNEVRALEADLAHMEPVELNEDQFDSMSAQMDLASVEQELEALSVAPMVQSQIDQLAQLMQESNSETDTKIVEFKSAAKSSRMQTWAAAAAVAVIAAVAFTITQTSDSATPETTAGGNEIKQTPSVGVFDVSGGEEVEFSSHSENIINASNGGVVMSKENNPQRVVKVRYEEVIRVLGKDGKLYEKRTPRTKVYMIPVETN